MNEIIGDYREFFDVLEHGLEDMSVDVSGYNISHLGYKASSIQEYKEVNAALSGYAKATVENVHNGRPIAKILLKEPLILGEDKTVDLLEIMPPKSTPNRVDGLEHIGFVVGKRLDDFKARNEGVIDEIQNQGPFCQPACIILKNGYRAKFYEHSLQKVVELEGKEF